MSAINNVRRQDFVPLQEIALEEVVIQSDPQESTQTVAAPKDYTWWPPVLAEVIAEYAGDRKLVALGNPWENGFARTAEAAAEIEWLKFQAAVEADREKANPTLHLIFRCISNNKTLVSATDKLIKANLFVGINRNEMNADLLLDEGTAQVSRDRRRRIQDESDFLSLHIDEDACPFQLTCSSSVVLCLGFITLAILLQPFQTPTRAGVTGAVGALLCICCCCACISYKDHRKTNDSIAAQQAINAPSIELEEELEETERG